MKMTIEVDPPPASVDIIVDFYDGDEKEAFLKHTSVPRLADLPKLISVPTPDLLAYYLYHKLQPGVRGYSTHSDLAEKWMQALFEFDGQVAFSESSIYIEENAHVTNPVAERLGEAIGLSVSGWIHDLQQADWQRIAITSKRKTMDFSLVASDGSLFVQLEAKGSSVVSVDRLGKAYGHVQSIKAKKSAASDDERLRSLCYGTIASINADAGAPARCWLVDPPAEIPGDPKQYKLLSRMVYIADLISLVSPRSSFSTALQNRAQILWNVGDPMSLDALPLYRGDGMPVDFDARYYSRGAVGRFFNFKSYLIGRSVFGDVSLVGQSAVVFIGCDEVVVSLAARQEFSDIVSYKVKSEVVDSEIMCIVSAYRFDSEKWGLFMPGLRVESRAGYVQFRLSCRVFVSASGLAFGWVSVPLPA